MTAVCSDFHPAVASCCRPETLCLWWLQYLLGTSPGGWLLLWMQLIGWAEILCALWILRPPSAFLSCCWFGFLLLQGTYPWPPLTREFDIASCKYLIEPSHGHLWKHTEPSYAQCRQWDFITFYLAYFNGSSDHVLYVFRCSVYCLRWRSVFIFGHFEFFSRPAFPGRPVECPGTIE